MVRDLANILAADPEVHETVGRGNHWHLAKLTRRRTRQ